MKQRRQVESGGPGATRPRTRGRWAPRTGKRAGFTLVEAIVIVGIVVLLALALYAWILPNVESAIATSMKSKGRGVWIAIVSANSEIQGAEGTNSVWPKALGGTNSVWPKALGFDNSRTSTEYFRLLMSDANGCPAKTPNEQLVSDLGPWAFCGAGIPRPRSTEQFSKRNNPWAVCCVDDATPSEALFLVTRNVDMGRTLSAASPMVLTRETPFGRRRAVWVTRGGGIFDARAKYLLAIRNPVSTNLTCDVMYP